MYRLFGKRLFDVVAATLGIILLLPLFILISLFILVKEGRPVFFVQARLGRYGRTFSLIKFRSMTLEKDPASFVTSADDPRITPIGRVLRRYKLDELPQLINVIKGDMSLVGPRPEVEKYAKFYPEAYQRVLSVRPGISDYATIAYQHEEKILMQYDDREKAYIDIILRDKIDLYFKYIETYSFWVDLTLIFKTIFRVSQQTLPS